MKKSMFFIILLLTGFTIIKAQSAEEPKGKILFKENKCVGCHAIEMQGFVKKGKSSAPDLSSVGNILKPDFMMKYLMKEEKLNDLKHAISFKGSKEELKTLVDWLSTLKKEEAKKELK
jgi:hypothetical protein